ncbi:MAG: MoaD/ThiS family protein [Lysobacterales bacterium]
MRIKVRYFAAFRDDAGCSEEFVDSAVSTPGELFEQCRSRHRGLHRHAASMVAVNDEMAHWDTPLADGDEVLFFPPVAGG